MYKFLKAGRKSPNKGKHCGINPNSHISRLKTVGVFVLGESVSDLVLLAASEARALGHSYVGTAHLLIAISGTLLLASQWMGGEMIRFTQNILERFPGITK